MTARDDPSPTETVAAELELLRARNLSRRMPQITGLQGVMIDVDGRLAINFCSNNYLGLADHPALTGAAAQVMASAGFGAGASRLITGNLTVHRQLEADLARWKGTEAALLFNSGYHANVGILAALAGPPDGLYSDALNHASIIDGARLSRAAVHVYPHNDVGALAALLGAGRTFRRRIIITESLFSMDGDVAPLAALARLAREHGALLVVDDAHAAGALGEQGTGLAGGVGADLQMGTLSKAFGAFGAYAAGSGLLIDLLVNRARSFIFTTALPAPVAAAGRAALALVASEEGDARRRRLRENRDLLHRGLVALGLVDRDRDRSHIVPLVVGDAARAVRLSDALLDHGLFVQAIRPPTVPTGSARLRVTVTATHQDEHISLLLTALTALRSEFPAALQPCSRPGAAP